MDKLSYLTTFVALIYGLGIANALTHLSRLLKRGRDADWFWVHASWMLYLVLFMASQWWVLLNWGTVRHIGYYDYLSLLLVPSLAFVASDLLFPARAAEGPVSLRAHFYAVRKRLFLLVLVMLLSDEVDSALKGWDHLVALGPWYWGTQAYWFGACAVGYRSGSDRIQGAIVTGGIAVLLASMSHILATV
jgi:hypothetical protein